MNARIVFEHRLFFLAVLAGGLTTTLALVHVLAASGLLLLSEAWRTAAILAPVPLAALVMACVSPAASSDDLSPALERSMLYASIVQAAAAIMVWANAAPWHPCHSLTTLPGVLACAAVPLFGMRNALHYWPAHRCAMVASGALQFVRTAAQAHALRLADAAAALGLTKLLPASAAMQCQAHPLFLPGGVSQSAALGFGLVALVTGLALTPAMRTRLAILSGPFGLPAARVLTLGDGVSLETAPVEERNEEQERLLYDVQRRSRPLDNHRSPSRSGLQVGGGSQPYQHGAGDRGPSEREAPLPSDAPPPSLPPGAPSSTADQSSTWVVAEIVIWSLSAVGRRRTGDGSTQRPESKVCRAACLGSGGTFPPPLDSD